MTANTLMEPVHIIEYDPIYAGALAEMWNRSNESWGGGTNQRTEDTVRREMETTSNLHVFLAVAGKEVVGFCSFAHYRQDEGALYVPLLNVRPDYHGYKVGRNLILHAVRRTVELGWPRLDLFTWAGNTKAVPMYKKCGFFWEKNESYVHLMNFIPTILQTEALAPYFKELDWYADSTREVPVQPDGRRERGFDFLEYSWQKDGLSLRAEFEKSGRGLTALDTPDFEISTEIEDHHLVFGSLYKVRYRIKNRSTSGLSIEIQGRSDKNILFDLRAAHTLAPGETVTVEGDFKLEPIIEEQNEKKTHPVVRSEWIIGGRRAEFRIGIAPKFPVKMSITLPGRELYPGLPAVLYINAENSYGCEAEFAFDLPEEDFLEWGERSVRFTVPAKGKVSIPVPLGLRSYGLYSKEVRVTATPAGDKSVSFTNKLSVLFKGSHGRFGGQAGDQWIAVNGPFSVHMNKTDNVMWVEYTGSSHSFWLAFPRLGKPFSEELSKKQAKEVKIYSEGESQNLEVIYDSEDFPDLTITMVVKLFASGITEFYYEVCNTGRTAREDSVYVMTSFGFFGKRLILPYQGRYVDMGDAYSGDKGYWDSAQVTENWLFSKEENVTAGICWDPSLTLRRPEYTLGLEHELGVIPAGEAVRTTAMVFALNTFPKWSEFRAFARKQREIVVPVLENHLELRLGGGNPFAAGNLQAELIERKMTPLAGDIELFIQNDGHGDQKIAGIELSREQNLRSAELGYSSGTMELPGSGESGRKVKVVYRGEDRIQERSGLWFPQSAAPVDCKIEEGAAGPIYSIGNGILSIAAAPKFGSVVHSLKYQGTEWLDSSFPEAVPRSWWNPWHGGLGVRIPGIGGFSRQLEPRSTSFVKRSDIHGNVWEGLQMTTSIEWQEAGRGMIVNQHYLMLPGVPVLCIMHSVTNGSGQLQPWYSLSEEGYFKPSPAFADNWFDLPGEGKFLLGTVEAELETKGIMVMGAVNRKDMLHVVHSYPNQHASVYVNNKVFSHNIDHHYSIRDGETVWTQPTFLILGRIPVHLADVSDLLKLNFTSPTDEKEILNADH